MSAIRRYMVLLALATACAGCDNTVDPFVDSDDHAFAVFGYLDLAEDTQLVRITPIRPAASRSPDPMPQRVVTTDLASGERVEWTDSLIALEDGSEGLLFAAKFRPAPGATYVLEVTSGASAPLRAFTRVPPAPALHAGTSTVAGGDVIQLLLWQGARSPTRVLVGYDVGLPGSVTSLVQIPYEPRFYTVVGDRVTISVNLSRDFRIVQQAVANGDDPIELRGARATIRTPSDEWNETIRGANIENGEGFFASVGQFTESWTVPDSLARRVGYTVP